MILDEGVVAGSELTFETTFSPPSGIGGVRMAWEVRLETVDSALTVERRSPSFRADQGHCGAMLRIGARPPKRD